MKKHVVVINGSGGVGKDTICDAAAQFWAVKNISSIQPILDLARYAGWDGKKTPEARRLLSRLKAALTEFNDLPLQYCLNAYHAFLHDDNEILFVHIREPQEIERFRRTVGSDCLAILVRRRALTEMRGSLGNASDDEVEAYRYDGYFDNSGTLEEIPDKVKHFFTDLLGTEQ